MGEPAARQRGRRVRPDGARLGHRLCVHGDTDTICAITGALAAMRFEVPGWMSAPLQGEPVEGLTDFREFNRIEYELTRQEVKLRAKLKRSA